MTTQIYHRHRACTGRNIKEIVLWFDANVSPYIKIQPLHASQQIVSDDSSGLVIKLNLVINYELISSLPAYCPDMCVVKPARLRDKMVELFTRGVKVNRKKEFAVNETYHV